MALKKIVDNFGARLLGSWRNAWLLNLAAPIAMVLYAPVNAMGDEPKYVGNDGCSCHSKEIALWNASPHSKAYTILQPGKRKTAKKHAGFDPDDDYSRERRCLKCHVTGYLEEGGFISIERTPEMQGIGCEMCHGPGSKYRLLHEEKRFGFGREEAKALGQVYGSEDKSVCELCHMQDDSPYKDRPHKSYRTNWLGTLERSPIYHIK